MASVTLSSLPIRLVTRSEESCREACVAPVVRVLNMILDLSLLGQAILKPSMEAFPRRMDFDPAMAQGQKFEQGNTNVLHCTDDILPIEVI